MSWPLVKLGSTISFIRGITFKPDDIVEPFTDGSIVVMRTKNVQASGLSLYDLIAVPKHFMRREEQKLQIGDLLISSANSWELVGKVSFVKSLGYESTAGGFISIIRPKTTKIDSRYLYHWISSPKSQHLIRHCGRQTTNISNLDVGRFKELEIPLPSIVEQKRIAAILDKADAIRRKRQQAIQLADEFLRAVFMDMFGSSADNVEWQEVRFDKVALIDAKMVDPREAKYLDLLHVGPDRIEKNTGKLLPALTAREENLISKKFLFDQSYVLYSKIRPYLRKVALPDFTGLCSADMYPVRPKDGLLTREYLWQLLLSDEFTQYTQTLPGRANIPKLNRSELASFSFQLPPIELQRKFSKICATHKKFLSGSNIAIKASEESFSAMSQKAFSGQL